MTVTHHTAWLVNDKSALDTEFCDVTVIEDQAISYTVDDDGTETPVWASQGDQMFHGLTTIPADGDMDDAQDQVEDMLRDAGWRTVGSWDVTDNAYIITVERDASAEPQTVTLISALSGDDVPGCELADPNCPEVPGLLDNPKVKAFFAEHGYGYDGDAAELMYLVTDATTEIPAGFPTLTISLT